MRSLFAVLFSCLLMTACGGTWQHYPQNDAGAGVSPAVINGDDMVTVTIFGEDNLSGEYRVTTDGYVTMPLAGKIAVAGLTADDAAKTIQKSYEKGYLVNPDVSLTITQSKNYSILGEVMTAGSYGFKPDMTVLEAVAQAGGFTYRANEREFDIIRKNHNAPDSHIKATLSTRLQSSDIIRVRERFF